jgi:tryptophanyl-tRNA synthetase
MSKSDASDLSRIVLTDDADTIAKKIRKAKTDPAPLSETLEDLKTRPEADNLVGIYAALAETDKETVLAEYGGKEFSVFKPALADLAVEKIAPITAEMQRLMADPGSVDEVLRDGSERARQIAMQTMREVKEIIGFVA